MVPEEIGRCLGWLFYQAMELQRATRTYELFWWSGNHSSSFCKHTKYQGTGKTLKENKSSNEYQVLVSETRKKKKNRKDVDKRFVKRAMTFGNSHFSSFSLCLTVCLVSLCSLTCTESIRKERGNSTTWWITYVAYLHVLQLFLSSTKSSLLHEISRPSDSDFVWLLRDHHSSAPSSFNVKQKFISML